MDGDILLATVIASLDTDETVGTFTDPGGGAWTLVRETATTYFRMRTLRRVASGEPANYTWTISASNRFVAHMVAYSAGDTGTPVDAENGQLNGASTTWTAPGVTTTVADTLLVGFFGAGGDTAATVTPPGGMDERGDNNVASGPTLETADVAFAGPGPTGDKSATGSSSLGNMGHLVAIRPAGGGGPTPNVQTPIASLFMPLVAA